MRQKIDYLRILGQPSSSWYEDDLDRNISLWYLKDVIFELVADGFGDSVQEFTWWVGSFVSTDTETVLSQLPKDWQEIVLFNLDLF